MTTPTMTPAQFARAYALGKAYGHLWATLLASPPEGEHNVAAYALRVAEKGYGLPIIEALALRYESPHFGGITTPDLTHETCTGRTRWDILPDGEVRFERVERRGAYDAEYTYTDTSRTLAKSRVYRARNGQDVAEIDYLVPRAEWPEDAVEGILRSLLAAGCDEAEANRAFDFADVRASVARAA